MLEENFDRARKIWVSSSRGYTNQVVSNAALVGIAFLQAQAVHAWELSRWATPILVQMYVWIGVRYQIWWFCCDKGEYIRMW